MLKKRRINIYNKFKQIWKNAKDYKFRSIFIKYFLLLFICLVLPVLGLVFMYGKALYNSTAKEALKTNEAMLEQTYGRVETIFKSMQNVAYSIANASSTAYLSTLKTISNDKSRNREGLSDTLYTIMSSNQYVDSIYVYMNKSKEIVEKNGVSAIDNFMDTEWYDKVNSHTNTNKISIYSRKKYDSYPYLITFFYPVKNIGAIIINVNVESLADYLGTGSFEPARDDPVLFITDSGMNKIMYSDAYILLRSPEKLLNELQTLSIEDGLTSGFVDIMESKYVASSIRSEKNEICYIYLSSFQKYILQRESWSKKICIIAIIATLICLVLAMMLAVWVYRPIRYTISILDEMSMLSPNDKKTHMNEIEIIQRSMAGIQKDRDKNNSLLKERMVHLNNAQMNALQMQINPHFLYNTLESIGNASALLLNDNNPVTDMLFTLGKLLRISLSSKNYLVSIQEELEHVSLYVKIMEFRFHGKILVHITIPEEVRNEKIVKLTLQPLIENAIEHGFHRHYENGNIWVTSDVKQNQIYIHVSDDGDGITEEQLDILREQLKESSMNANKHIGLQNVNQRLKLVYGENYGIELSHAAQGGLKVTLHFIATSLNS